MFGYHDYTTDPRSGRPQPHISWVGEWISTWLAGVAAVTSFVGAIANYVIWHDTHASAQLTLAAVTFALIALWRQTMLTRKHRAYRDAVAAYHAMLFDLAE